MIRLDKIKGSAHIASFTFATTLTNGAVVALGALNTDGESYIGGAVANVATDKIVFHASVELQYAVDAMEEDYTLKIGGKGRGYILEKGDIVTITDDQLTGTTVVGGFVLPVVGTKLAFSASARTTENLAFQVIEKTTLGGAVATALEVIYA